MADELLPLGEGHEPEPEAEVEAKEGAARAIAAISAGCCATMELAEFLKWGGDKSRHDLTITEVVEHAADALRCTIHAAGRTDWEANQLLGAVNKYLDGWVG